MKINGADRHRMAAVHPADPYLLHLVSNEAYIAECGAEIHPGDRWVAVVIVDGDPYVCDDCDTGRQLRRLVSHREVDLARLGKKMLHELRAVYQEARTRELGRLLASGIDMPEMTPLARPETATATAEEKAHE